MERCNLKTEPGENDGANCGYFDLYCYPNFYTYVLSGLDFDVYLESQHFKTLGCKTYKKYIKKFLEFV